MILPWNRQSFPKKGSNSTLEPICVQHSRFHCAQFEVLVFYLGLQIKLNWAAGGETPDWFISLMLIQENEKQTSKIRTQQHFHQPQTSKNPKSYYRNYRRDERKHKRWSGLLANTTMEQEIVVNLSFHHNMSWQPQTELCQFL